MKNFLSTTKGKIIAGSITLAVIAAAIVLIIVLNTGYRSIQVADLNGSTKITSGSMVSEAFKGQKLQNNTSVSVSENSDLTLALDTDKHVYAKELTRFRLEAFGTAGKDSRTIIRLEEGSVLNEIDEKLLDSESYVVDAPNATMAVRGTTFTVTVSYDENGLCHTAVEVEEGTVEVIEKDENGFPTDNVQTLNAGDKTEVISLVVNRNEDNDILGGNSSSSNNNSTPERIEVTYQNPEAIAVENALEAYFNGGDLDTTNFDRITRLEIWGKVAFVTLDYKFGGRGRSSGWDTKDSELIKVSYSPSSGEEFDIPTSNGSLTDLNFLIGMKNLHELRFFYGNITDITSISHLSSLTHLQLNNHKISDIPSLENLTNLTFLSLSKNQISDFSSIISSIKKLKNLRTLYLSDNNISDITSLEDMTNLTQLSFDGNKISDISSIKYLKKLKYLRLTFNNISDISPLKDLTNLKTLHLHSNQISDISPLKGLKNLEDLTISNNNISDISPLENLTKLTHLDTRSNQISDYSSLYGLTNLERVYLDAGIEREKLQQALPDAKII